MIGRANTMVDSRDTNQSERVATDKMSQGNEMLRARDVAVTCAVSERSVRRWIKDGRLAYFRLAPNVLRFRTSDVESLLRRLRVPAASERRGGQPS
jgi:predicted DNA-binding transcriptional regulator AlpA